MSRAEPVRLSVRFYSQTNGSEPVRELLLELPRDDRRAIGVDIKTVQFGWPLGMPVVRKLEPRLWGIRSDLRDGIARVLLTTVDQTMVLLHGVIKKQQKLARSDLDLARRRTKEVHHG